MTDSISLAMGESSPVKVRCSLTNSIRTPLSVSVCTMWRRSSKLRASRSMLGPLSSHPSPLWLHKRLALDHRKRIDRFAVDRLEVRLRPVRVATGVKGDKQRAIGVALHDFNVIT